MSTRAIRTSTAQATCDVCGRTLLRGEQAHIYLSGGARHSVCELCTSRALHDGWVREGEVPEYDEGSRRPDRRRSLLHRLRGRRDGRDARGGGRDARGVREARGGRWGEQDPDLGYEPAPDFTGEDLPPPDAAPAPAPPAPRPRAAASGAERAPRGGSARRAASRLSMGREPRHVRAVPTSVEHRISSAMSIFNESEHPRTVAGIARSLGLPDVSVHPADANGSVVNIVVAWELCWYRYEVDLADEVPTVRVGAQGYELTELREIDQQNNAAADDAGRLTLRG